MVWIYLLNLHFFFFILNVAYSLFSLMYIPFKVVNFFCLLSQSKLLMYFALALLLITLCIFLVVRLLFPCHIYQSFLLIVFLLPPFYWWIHFLKFFVWFHTFMWCIYHSHFSFFYYLVVSIMSTLLLFLALIAWLLFSLCLWLLLLFLHYLMSHHSNIWSHILILLFLLPQAYEFLLSKHIKFVWHSSTSFYAESTFYFNPLIFW